jgi:hypothetical protein|eukprot:COSAG01_NODE_1329_length_10704_cov_34.202074_20_plen_85_part_00
MSKRCKKEVLGKRPISEATKRELKAIKVCAKSNIALDEGRMNKEKRLLKKSQRIQKRAKAQNQRREDRDLRQRGFNNMSRDGIA